MDLYNSILGKKIGYKSNYDSTLLFKISRENNRLALGLNSSYLPFYGVDVWNSYEISWLDRNGKPCVAIGKFFVPVTSPYIFESKSFKLYLNSFNNFVIDSRLELEKIILNDLSKVTDSKVIGKLLPLNTKMEFEEPTGKNIDYLDIECSNYGPVDRSLIKYEDIIVEEEINSNLLKSNCLVTGQPDWGTVIIKYKGKKLQYDSVIKYLVSFRNHNEFAEQCVEHIFTDIQNAIDPVFLSIYIVYNRRGGIDICPYRSSNADYQLPNQYVRFIRQ